MKYLAKYQSLILFTTIVIGVLMPAQVWDILMQILGVSSSMTGSTGLYQATLEGAYNISISLIAIGLMLHAYFLYKRQFVTDAENMRGIDVYDEKDVISLLSQKSTLGMHFIYWGVIFQFIAAIVKGYQTGGAMYATTESWGMLYWLMAITIGAKIGNLVMLLTTEDMKHEDGAVGYKRSDWFLVFNFFCAYGPALYAAHAFKLQWMVVALVVLACYQVYIWIDLWKNGTVVYQSMLRYQTRGFASVTGVWAMVATVFVLWMAAPEITDNNVVASIKARPSVVATFVGTVNGYQTFKTSAEKNVVGVINYENVVQHKKFYIKTANVDNVGTNYLMSDSLGALLGRLLMFAIAYSFILAMAFSSESKTDVTIKDSQGANENPKNGYRKHPKTKGSVE